MNDGDELIIVDDGSTDETLAFVLSFTSVDSRVKVYQRNHEGLVSALNFAISHAKYDLIARADADDLYFSNRLDLQVGFMDKNLDCEAVFCDYEFVDSAGKFYGCLPSAISPLLTYLSLLNHQRTPHPGVIFRKGAFLRAGQYQEDDFPVEDLGLWVRIGNRFNLGTIPSVLLSYRMHPESVSAKNRNLQLSKISAFREVVVKEIGTNTSWENELISIKDLYLHDQFRLRRIWLTVRDLIVLKRISNASISFRTLILAPRTLGGTYLSFFPTIWLLAKEKRARFRLRNASIRFSNPVDKET